MPGHGPVGTLKDVADFRTLLVDVRSAVAAAIKAGASEEAAVRESSPAAILQRSRDIPNGCRSIIRATYRYLKSR